MRKRTLISSAVAVTAAGAITLAGTMVAQAEETGDAGIVEDEHVVRLDVDAAEAEVRLPGQDFERDAVPSRDQDLVVLQVPEVRAMDVAASGGSPKPRG